MNKSLDENALDVALRSLAIRLAQNKAEPIEIVVCGGSALILTGPVSQATNDVDIVALMRGGRLLSPAPVPAALALAAKEVAEDLGLNENWLNNGPSQNEGGLFQMGLPAGLAERLHARSYGDSLTVHLVGRLDQIHFKLYAAADRGGYHMEDLRALSPAPDELEAAARWCMTHDVSKEFALLLKRLLKELGYAGVADRL